MTLQCPANFLHFLQSENIGSPDGDPIKRPEDAEEDKKQMDDDGAILMFEEGYHDSMNAEAYESWFEKRSCPNLEPNFVIVNDNASYHS